MEIKGTNYAKRRKDVLVVTLGTEEDSFELRILPPTKGVHDGLVAVAGYVADAARGNAASSDLDLGRCLDLVAAAMSHNTDVRVITGDYLESIGFDLSDVGDFIGLYTYFVSELVDSKN